MKTKYALKKKGLYVKTFDPTKYTPDLDKALLYVKKTIDDDLDYIHSHSLEVVEIEVSRNVVAVTPSQPLFDAAFAKLEIEFKELDKLAQADLDGMEEKTYRRWKRLKTCMKRKCLDRY